MSFPFLLCFLAQADVTMGVVCGVPSAKRGSGACGVLTIPLRRQEIPLLSGCAAVAKRPFRVRVFRLDEGLGSVYSIGDRFGRARLLVFQEVW
jgi:hypothetical protein